MVEVRRSFPPSRKPMTSELFYRIYDDPNVDSAKRAFEAWENSLPVQGWTISRGSPRQSTTTTTTSSCTGIRRYGSLTPNRMPERPDEAGQQDGAWLQAQIIRAKVLYAKYARKVGSGVRIAAASGSQQTVEYGRIFRPWSRVPSRVRWTEKSVSNQIGFRRISISWSASTKPGLTRNGFPTNQILISNPRLHIADQT